MGQALHFAKQAAIQNEVPVGAVLICEDQVLAGSFNAPISNNDPCAHAEILALRAAAAVTGNYRLPKTTLYVTLEPCVMCAGAIVHARIERLVYGAFDVKAGAICSRANVLDWPYLNHRVQYAGGLLEEECAEMLKSFFKARRK